MCNNINNNNNNENNRKARRKEGEREGRHREMVYAIIVQIKKTIVFVTYSRLASSTVSTCSTSCSSSSVKLLPPLLLVLCLNDT